MFYIDVLFPFFSFVFPLWILWITQWISLFFNIFRFFSSWITAKSYTPTLCSFLCFVNLCIFLCLLCTIFRHSSWENPFLTVFWKYSLLSDISPKVLDFSVEIFLLFPKQKAEYSCKNRKITHIKNQITDFLHWKFRKTNIICHRTFFHSVYKVTKSSSKK